MQQTITTYPTTKVATEQAPRRVGSVERGVATLASNTDQLDAAVVNLSQRLQCVSRPPDEPVNQDAHIGSDTEPCELGTKLAVLSDRIAMLTRSLNDMNERLEL